MGRSDSELTRLVAEKVMGWRVHFRNTAFYVKAGEENGIMTTIERQVRDFHPLTDWRAAGEIVEKMRADGWYFEAKDYVQDKDRFTRVRVERTMHVNGAYEFKYGIYDHANTPRAITMASLIAIGAVQEPDL